MALVDVVRDHAVARLWFDRPDRHNALSPELCAELAAALHALAHDDAVRVVVLGGRGPSFCAGADIGAMKASATATFEDNLAEARARHLDHKAKELTLLLRRFDRAHPAQSRL